jgi:predicted RNase H-like HicB family nuclease
MSDLRYPFRVVPDGEGWSIWFPDLLGCTSYSPTWEGIGAQAREAMELWLEFEIKEEHPIPIPSEDGLDDLWPQRLSVS